MAILILFYIYIKEIILMRTLILTESQIKNVIEKIISEQGTVNSFFVDFGNSFESGRYQIQGQYQRILVENVRKIYDYIKEKNITNFYLNISAGESQVPNQTNPETNERFGKGELAQKRSQVLQKYLESIMSKMLGKVPTIKISNPIIGKVPWDGLNKDASKYKKDQFVRVYIVIDDTIPPPPPPPVKMNSESNLGEPVYGSNQQLVGYISEPFTNVQSKTDSGFQKLGSQEQTFTFVNKDTAVTMGGKVNPKAFGDKYKIPYQWWNNERSNPTTNVVSMDDLNYIRTNFQKTN